MNLDKSEDSPAPDDHTMSPDPEREQDNESDDDNKYKTDAKSTHATPTRNELEDDLLHVEDSEDEDNSVGSTTEAMLDTDSLAESLHEERTSDRNPRRCKKKSPGSYAQMHRGSRQTLKGKKPKNSKDKKINQISQKKIILQLEQENKELREKLRQEIPEANPPNGTEQENNRQKIKELEAEIDILAKQIEENDEHENKQQQLETTKIEQELKQAKEQIDDLQKEIENLNEKIQELESENKKIANEHHDMKRKLKEETKRAKSMEKTAKQASSEKAALEQVAQMKSTEIAELKGKLERLQEQQTELDMEEHEELQPQPTTILIGDSNCRDIHPHLMRWLNQTIITEWAPTLMDVKFWAENKREMIEGKQVIVLAGTNDLKRGDTKHEVSAAHKEATEAIQEAGAQLIVVQLPPVYYPQIRAESRFKDTEILNEILLERHGEATARADKITLHRGQMKRDGLHITNESVEIMAESITDALTRVTTGPPDENFQITIRNDNERPETQNNNTTKELTTTKQVAAKLIGKGGERIRKIKTLYKVEINTIETGDDNRTFLIKGPANHAIKVQRIIKDIAKEVEERDREQQAMASYTNALPARPTKIQTICRFFLKGRCKRGQTCKFIHQTGPVDISMSSETSSESEEPEREPTPVRKVTVQPTEEPSNTTAKKTRREKAKDYDRKPRSPHRDQKHTITRTDSDDGSPDHRARSRKRTSTRKETSSNRKSTSTHSSRSHHRHTSTREKTPDRKERTRERTPNHHKEQRSRPHTPPHRRYDYQHRYTRSRSATRDRHSRTEMTPDRYQERYPSRRSSPRRRRTPSPRRHSPPSRRSLDRRESRRHHSPPRRQDRSRSHSPHRESRRHQHRHRSYEDTDLAEAIAKILSRGGKR